MGIKKTIRPSTEGDIAEMMRIFAHSKQIMRANGNLKQWAGAYPDEEQVRQDIAHGTSYIVEYNGRISGTFVFVIGKDPTYSEIAGGEWKEDTLPYGTLHRMACTEGVNGIAETALDWCATQIDNLRADTHADNHIMQHILEKYGFKYCGVIRVADGTPRNAYQRLRLEVGNMELEHYVEQEILPRYDHFDAAHQRDHAEKVIEQSLVLGHFYPTRPDMLYAIAAFHDTGLAFGRERHHIESGRIIREDPMLPKWFTADEIETMAQAAEDHRASGKNPPRSIYGKIAAEADRDIESEKIVRRTVQYGLANYPELDKEAQWERTIAHLEEKYAPGGYMKLWLPESKNSQKITELHALIANKERLRDLFNEIYRSERGE